ncbi:SIMPL domain-containing protein [Croceivirga sp. JEA036]|uniref:SIMPL domain-containing protein n=1 Tax=Croceivirga sp. JEA036 TaxID=2721162 RepID=UPI00143968FF|nr:SIMPL domain-containing protein [Croceivirga sp. JEA036]NJB38028.1 SIMPL domain-containing protein [Croceivirga sp. JEA036]
MKNLIYIIVLTLSSLSSAQEVDNRKAITVNGATAMKRSITGYKAKVVLNTDQLSYINPAYTSLEDLKSGYYKMLKEKGFDTSKFKEDALAYMLMGYQNRGIVLVYETQDENQIKLLSDNRFGGINLTILKQSSFDEATHQRMIKEALADAKTNAERLASAANKKVGDIIFLSERSNNKVLWESYSADYEQYFELIVSYELN